MDYQLSLAIQSIEKAQNLTIRWPGVILTYQFWFQRFEFINVRLSFWYKTQFCTKTQISDDSVLIWIYVFFNRLTNFNTHTTKKFTPQNSSWYWRTNCILHSIWFCDSDTWKCNVRTVTQNLGISIQIPISGFNFRCNPFSKINFQFEPILPECIEVNFRWSLLKHLPQRKSLSMQKMQIYGP